MKDEIKLQALDLIEQGVSFEEMSIVYHLAALGWVEAGMPEEYNETLNRFCDLANAVGEMTEEIKLISEGL